MAYWNLHKKFQLPSAIGLRDFEFQSHPTWMGGSTSIQCALSGLSHNQYPVRARLFLCCQGENLNNLLLQATNHRKVPLARAFYKNILVILQQIKMLNVFVIIRPVFKNTNISIDDIIRSLEIQPPYGGLLSSSCGGLKGPTDGRTDNGFKGVIFLLDVKFFRFRLQSYSKQIVLKNRLVPALLQK